MIYNNTEIGKVLFGANELQRVYYGQTLVYEKEDSGYVDEYPDFDIVLDWTTNQDPWKDNTSASLEAMYKSWKYLRYNSGQTMKYNRDSSTISKNNSPTVITSMIFSFNYNLTNGTSNWATNPYLKRVIKIPIDKNITSITRMFTNCTMLNYIYANWDFSNVSSQTSSNYIFEKCTHLETIEGRIKGIKYNISLSDCPLTRDSALVFINGIEDVGTKRTLTLSKETYFSLSSEDIATASAKGWTITV